jgi:predicted Fe-S protein YdhL (DUF1289 family)
MTAVVSPCVRLCAIDHVSGLCAGCGRTLDEIANWLSYDDATRRAIMASLPERMAKVECRDRQAARP